MFWLACERFKNAVDDVNAQMEAEDIFVKYLEEASTNEVSNSGKMYKVK